MKITLEKNKLYSVTFRNGSLRNMLGCEIAMRIKKQIAKQHETRQDILRVSMIG